MQFRTVFIRLHYYFGRSDLKVATEFILENSYTFTFDGTVDAVFDSHMEQIFVKPTDSYSRCDFLCL